MKPEIDPHILQTVKTVMTRHIGSVNSISYDNLTEIIYGKATENNKRKLRAVIAAINAEPDNKIVICSDRENGGVFMNGSSEDDIARHIAFYHQERAQALTTLEKLRAMERKLGHLYGPELLHPIAPGQGRLL